MPPTMPLDAAAIYTDALVIGAGPAGLYAAFQLGLLGLDAQLIDALPEVGGQCQALYADKPIYDIPGMVHTTGRALAEQLLAQLALIRTEMPLAQRLHLGQVVTSATTVANAAGSAHYRISSSSGQVFFASCIILATGVGAFLPRSLNLPGINDIAACIHHRASAPADFAGHSVVIVGDEDEALHWACDLAQSGLPASVTLNHRRAQLAASASAQTRLQNLLAQGRLRFQPGLIQGLEHKAGQLQQLQLLQADGQAATLPCTRLGLLLGLSPKMGPLADWGLLLERRQLPVAPATMGSNLPGVFAIGDGISYPGKLKLIACAFHEATLAAHAALAYCAPERVTPLQYTTSSALLQGRLHLP